MNGENMPTPIKLLDGDDLGPRGYFCPEPALDQPATPAPTPPQEVTP